jgi:hypothetical protein
LPALHSFTLQNYFMKKILLFLILASGIHAHSEAQTLVAKWTFTNGTATDSSGNNLHGTVTGATATAGKTGLPNTALLFNGDSSMVDVPYNSKMNLNKLTIVALVKPLGFDSGACQGNFILGRGDGWYPNSHPYNLHLTDNSWDTSCSVYTPTQTTFVSNFPGTTSNPSGSVWSYTPGTNLNQWYCVISTMDGANTKIYVDGVLKVTVPYTPDSTPSTLPISIGYSSVGVSTGYPYYFHGAIDHIELWDGVLSASAITAKCGSTTEIEEDASRVKAIQNPYPSPASTVLNVPVRTTGGAVSVSVISVDGKRMQTSIQQVGTGDQKIEISVVDLPAGTYMLEIIEDGLRRMQRVSKM